MIGFRSQIITKERIETLDLMKFSCPLQDESWEAMRKQLADYRDQYGDCNVPQKWPNSKQLANWVSKQRSEKRKFDQGLHAKITKVRIAALDSMDFSWNPLDDSWEDSIYLDIV